MTDQIGLFAPVEKETDLLAAPEIAPPAEPTHPFEMPVDTYAGDHGRTAANALEELKAAGWEVELSWELRINETYQIDLPDGLVTTAANVKTPRGDRWFIVWDPKPGNFFADDEIVRPGFESIKIESEHEEEKCICVWEPITRVGVGRIGQRKKTDNPACPKCHPVINH